MNTHPASAPSQITCTDRSHLMLSSSLSKSMLKPSQSRQHLFTSPPSFHTSFSPAPISPSSPARPAERRGGCPPTSPGPCGCRRQVKTGGLLGLARGSCAPAVRPGRPDARREPSSHLPPPHPPPLPSPKLAAVASAGSRCRT